MTGTPIESGPEKLGGAPEGKQPLRLWLRLLTCTNLIEGRIRSRLRKQFATTLPRFDMLATLDHASGGLAMGELSRRLLVSNGNVTMVADRLEAEGMIRRRASPGDRRTTIVSLTRKGRAAFAELAGHHEEWINDMLAGLGDEDVETMLTLLGHTKVRIENSASTGEIQ